MKKINKKNKFFFVTRGPGETSQARALAKFISRKEGEIFFALHQKINYRFLEKDQKDFTIFLIKHPNKLKVLIKKIKPDVLLLFNSKMWGKYGSFQENPPSPKPITICVDSNWLFNEKKYPFYNFVKWADKYLVNIPKKIFTFGLKENGGNFIISQSMQKEIAPVGFIPSYKKISLKEKLKIRKKYKIKKDEKLIFSYFSGFGAGHRIWAFYNLIKATEKLIRKGFKIKIIYIYFSKNLLPKDLKKNWLILKEYLNINEFYSTLASSDLVFQHQGLATLSQAISAQIPVVANVSIRSKERLSKIHFWEVEPFYKAGVCLMFSKSTPINIISEGIERLLYNSFETRKMQESQKKHYFSGEKKAYQIIKKLINPAPLLAPHLSSETQRYY